METKIYRVRLTKIKSNHQNLRTDVIEGYTYSLPTIRSQFMMYGEGLEFGTRIIYTTEVENVEIIDNKFRFRTRNSEYLVELL